MSTQTQIFYRGDGTTVLFSFPFPYIDESHVTVALLNDTTKAYDDIPQDDATYPWRLATASQVEFTSTAPPTPSSGDPDNILIERRTDADAAYATFFPGSPIKAADLNDNFEQSIYVAQESATVSKRAEDLVESVEILSIQTKAIADQAGADASQAKSDASTALSTANSAQTLANDAATDASNALTQASAANTNATQAAVDAAQARSDAATAVTDSNQAVTDSSSALSLATTADSNATTALNTANTANTNATVALAQSNTAISDSTAAKASADAAVSAVANSLSYAQITNVAAIPGSPSENDAIQVVDSTGLESFTPLTGLPAGYVGDAGIAARLVYNAPNWVFQNYIANDPDARYLNPTDALELIKRDGSVSMTSRLRLNGDTSISGNGGFSFGGSGGIITRSGTGLKINDQDLSELARFRVDTGVSFTGNVNVTGTVDGRDVAADGTKLDGIEAGATGDQTASEILALLLTVDGAGSNLDADRLDGQSSDYYLNYNNLTNKPVLASTSLSDSADLVRGNDNISRLNNNAGYLTAVPNGSVTTAKLVNGAVTSAKLADTYVKTNTGAWAFNGEYLEYNGALNRCLQFDVSENALYLGPSNTFNRVIVGSPLQANGTQSVTYSNYGYLNSSGNTGSISGSQTASYSIVATNGRVSAQEFNATSDRRLKHTIQDVTSADATNFIQNVEPVSFYWKDGEEKGLKHGYIAQNVADAGFLDMLGFYPAQVEGDEFDPVTGIKNPEDGYYTVNYEGAIPLLHKALADALERIAHLETLINDQSA